MNLDFWKQKMGGKFVPITSWEFPPLMTGSGKDFWGRAGDQTMICFKNSADQR